MAMNALSLNGNMSISKARLYEEKPCVPFPKSGFTNSRARALFSAELKPIRRAPSQPSIIIVSTIISFFFLHNPFSISFINRVLLSQDTIVGAILHSNLRNRLITGTLHLRFEASLYTPAERLLLLLARIKKIMQSDEEVGKIASATPVLVSKALELFLQDLCHRTYEITLKRGAKIMSSFHLKECVQIHNVFDFLQETVSHVPDLGCNRGGQNGRRRKTVDGENDDSCEEDIKRSKGMSHELAVSSRGRGRGHGRGRGRKIVEKNDAESDQLDDPETAYSPQLSDECETHFQNLVTKGESSEAAVTSPQPQPKDFDLNMELDENGEVAGLHTSDLALKSFKLTGWLPPYQTNSHLFEVSSHQNVLQSEEDYDCEDDC